jgi:hypothetical protein
MQGARYVRLIPWTLQSGSEQLVLTLFVCPSGLFDSKEVSFKLFDQIGHRLYLVVRFCPYR